MSLTLQKTNKNTSWESESIHCVIKHNRMQLICPNNSNYESKNIPVWVFGFYIYILSNITQTTAIFLNIIVWAIANVILILYNSSTNKKLILSELHFTHNIICFDNENSSNQSRIRTFVRLRATLWCFVSEWICFELIIWVNDSMIYS